jgi:DNA-binding LacI/PurR family transcriptional regulator
VALFFPTYLHLLRRGIRIPEDVSLISTDFHPQFNWCVPPVSHFNWNPRDVILRILRWANNTAMGKEDLKKKTLEASFVAKGTTGPAPGFSAKK